ncbi:molybdopterin-dependent oxidoreductase [Pseudonocardia broussonetiae]|uniref:molybdopterin-dependent oxidoreductase n=1 Tax=Pseudonocardia broussonetiae TaxID=2736640 RepID=UPI001F03E12D|nr:molybdopterin-dependent oxidoreductase [Pseudonocardia broussonetiae]
MSTTTDAPAPLLPRRTAALVGVLSVAAALGAGHLVAGLVSPASSPFLAVGNGAIALAPQWLVEFAKSAFGTADKPVLLAGMALVLAAAAAGAGLASRARPQPGVRAITALGLLGFAAVALSPAFTPVDLLAPAASAGAGILVLRRLHALAQPRPATAGPGRRSVLAGASGVVAFGALAAGGLGQLLGGRLTGSRDEVTAALRGLPRAERAPAVPAGAAFPDQGTPTFLTSNADFYRIDTALRIPTQTAADWSLRIHGMVGRELVLTFDDLLARPLVERTITMICVSNEVGGEYVSTADFVGVDLRAILLEAGIAPGADQVLSTSSDGLWTAGTPVDVLLEPDRGALLAVGMNGEALPPEHGFPVRMVVPGLYGYVSATKWVTDLEVTTFGAKQAYWLQRGWGERGPVKTQSRIDAPRGYGSTPAGRVAVAGIAWSPPRGVSRVEVRLDDGPWADAELATEVGGRTWRMWRTSVDVVPGSHVVAVRATDADGTTQTEERADVLPDGATGYHSVVFTAS